MSKGERTEPDLPEGFEKYGDAKDRRAGRIRLLEHGDEAAGRVAVKVGDCKRDHKCQSAACPICVGNFRLRLYRGAMPVFASCPNWIRASIIPAGMLVPRGQLRSFNLRALNKRIAKRLERSSLRSRKIFCGIDVSLNVRDNVVIGWQFHLYILLEGQNSTQVQETLRAVFPPEPTAKVPYRFRPVTDPSATVTYLFKGLFVRRAEYRTPDGKPRTRNLRLKGPEMRELLKFLDQFPIGARLILRGVRRDGKRLIPTKPD